MEAAIYGDEAARQRVRIFVASPGDLSEERARVRMVVNFLNQRYQREAYLDPYFWEDHSFGAHTSFQRSIPDASQFDIVLGLFWSRIGAPDPRLPTMPQVLTRGNAAPPDGFDGDEPFPGGAAYEVLEALEMQARTRSLDEQVYVFRRLDAPRVSISDGVSLENARAQWQGVEKFFERWFEGRDGTNRRAYRSYATTESQSGPDAFESLLQKVLHDWMHKKGFSSIVWPIKDLGSPFRGLETFDYRHRSIFFGRDRKVRRAFKLLQERAERFGHAEHLQSYLSENQTGQDRKLLPFLLIFGASGAGKSSFMRAGLAPLIVPPGETRSRIALIPTPGASNGGPALALARALVGDRIVEKDAGGLAPALPELMPFYYKDAASLASLFKEGKPEFMHIATNHIVTTLDRIGRQQDTHASPSGVAQCRLLILVDQLEELFNPGIGEAEREAFSQLLIELMETGRVWVVATLRADFYERMLVRPFVMLQDAGVHYKLAPPGPDEIEEIVVRSAEAAGLTYEISETGERLDQRLIEDAQDQNVLPFLMYVLNRIFEEQQSRGDRMLRFADYEKIGGLKGAIDSAASDAYNKLVSITALGTPLIAVPDESTVSPTKNSVTELYRKRNAPDRSVSRYDFFIAYATPDRQYAESLGWFLQDKSCEVFLDVEALRPGTLWQPALREAFEVSRAIVVLVSTHTYNAFYQQEEIVRAIQLARNKPGAHTVIPVLLEKLPQGPVSMPYGMSSLHAVDATRSGGLKRVATDLVAGLHDHQLDAE